MNNSIPKTYNLFYQYIVKLKSIFGTKVFRFKKWEIHVIGDVIQNNSNKGLILDFGCSAGVITFYLAKRFGSKLAKTV